jgi:hypothetical protein
MESSQRNTGAGFPYQGRYQERERQKARAESTCQREKTENHSEKVGGERERGVTFGVTLREMQN